jgi:hypothetical protein
MLRRDGPHLGLAVLRPRVFLVGSFGIKPISSHLQHEGVDGHEVGDDRGLAQRGG